MTLFCEQDATIAQTLTHIGMGEGRSEVFICGPFFVKLKYKS